MLENFTGSDIAAAATLSLFSFLASVVQGSTSLGDGIILQILWAVLQQLVPYATTQSALGGDGMRMITLFMYVRLALIPPYLLWKLWMGHKKRKRVAIAEATAVAAAKSAVEAEASGGVLSPTSPTTPVVVDVPTMFSLRLFWILLIPNTTWCILGVLILQNAKSDVIAVYMGSICIFFSFVYMTLKIWKTTPALSRSMPPWLKSIISPRFIVEGTKDQITIAGQISAFVSFNLVGIMTTLAGIGGPPWMIMILLFEMPMDMTRFTFPIGTLIGAYVRLIYSLYKGVLSLEVLWPFFLPAIVAGLIGINIGVRIGNVLSPSMYSASIFCLLILAGIVMLTSNSMITVPALVISCLALLFKQFYLDREEENDTHQSAPQKESKADASVTVIDPQQTNNNAASPTDLIPHHYHHQHRYTNEDLDRSSKYCEAEAMEMVS